MIPDFIWAKWTVEQEDAAGHEGAEHVVALEEYPLVAGDEVGFANEVAGANRLRSERRRCDTVIAPDFLES